MAIRGFGNLREMEWTDQRLRFHWENHCMNPFLIGLALGLFELATDAEGDVKWEAAGYGDLTVEVSPNA